MPRYFFNAGDESHGKDETGVELPNMSAARVHGIKRAGEVISDDPQKLWDGREFSLKVSDDRGLKLFIITCYATNCPAGGGTR